MSSTLLDYDSAVEFEGTLKMEKDWVLLNVPKDVHQQLVDSLNLKIKPNQQPHISVIKDEKPCLNFSDWDNRVFDGEKVKFKINLSKVSHENGMHVWFDCYSPRLCQIREHFGLTVLKKDNVYLVNFHTTVGKLITPVAKNLRDQYRLSKRTHIDVLTMMQHI